ncbi:MAG TPA: hypothetical protein VFP38_05635, partial [Bradyrhizobium sp.]|nr:hypothetical protein [Bradyrhizobium sp.]
RISSHLFQDVFVGSGKRFRPGRPVGSELRRWRSICWLRAAGEPADEAGEDQLIEFAANYGQSLDWIVLISIRPSAGCTRSGTMNAIRR